MNQFAGKTVLVTGAAGFIGCDEGTLRSFSLQPDGRGRLLPGDGSHRIGKKLFSAGDMRNGQSLVVRALADGRAAAREADAFLRGEGGECFSNVF